MVEKQKHGEGAGVIGPTSALGLCNHLFLKQPHKNHIIGVPIAPKWVGMPGDMAIRGHPSLQIATQLSLPSLP